MTPIILRRRKLGRGSTNGICAASTTDIKVLRDWQSEWPEDTDEHPLIFRWGCTSNIPYSVYTCVNRARSIHWCANKRTSRLEMQAAGVPVPKTWEHVAAWEGDGCHMPVIVRPETHSQGKQILFVDGTQNEYQFPSPCYISTYIPKVAEYRVAVIQNRVAWVAQKTPADSSAIAWNVAQGGRFDNVRWGNWPIQVIVAALAAAKLSGTDFCGVDIMVDGDGKPYVLEINSAPSQTSLYRQTCFAKCFDWIVKNGKGHFEDIESPRRWRDVIHPAIGG